MKEIVSLLEEDQIDFANHKRPEVLMVLKENFVLKKIGLLPLSTNINLLKKNLKKFNKPF